jgi:hypothetical protein
MPGMNRMIKGQPHGLSYMTREEMEAMNQLKREPGLRGRLARSGAKKKMEFVDGVPSFAPFMNATSNAIAEQVETDRRSQQAYDDAVAAQRAGLMGGSSDNDSGGGNPNAFLGSRYSQLQKEFDDYKAGEDKRKEEAIEGYRGEKRQQLTDEFADYKSRFKDLENKYDISAERDAVRGMAGEAKELGAQFGRDLSGMQGELSGYQSDVAGLRGDVSALRGQQAGIGSRLGGLAEQALDPASTDAYGRNRRMLAGVAEQQRNASNLAAQEQLNRGAAATGMSPEKLALARAQLSQGQGAQARQDALSSAMGAQQMTQSQLAQGAGLLGQQAGMGMQQANLLGQQAGLSQGAAGLAGQRAALMGQGAQFGAGLLAQRAGLQNQSAGLLGQQIQGTAGLMGQQVGMTQAQLQDTVAQQNQAFEKEMAEKGYAMQRETARMNRPQQPSQFGQLLSTAAAVAPVVAAFSDRGLKKNIRSAKEKDLMSPKEIDGFLDSLYAHQYNYKNAKHGKGKQVGVMAQDLEKTQLGKQMVEDTSEGKQVNYGKGLGLVLASQARLNQRLKSIGA